MSPANVLTGAVIAASNGTRYYHPLCQYGVRHVDIPFVQSSMRTNVYPVPDRVRPGNHDLKYHDQKLCTLAEALIEEAVIATKESRTVAATLTSG